MRQLGLNALGKDGALKLPYVVDVRLYSVRRLALLNGQTKNGFLLNALAQPSKLRRNMGHAAVKLRLL
jgi:hypothetical protein